jgi:ribosomal protein S18 acetylase RimI-like enzyme
MTTKLRPAKEADVPDLVRLYILATYGLMDATYHNLVPGVPLERTLEWRFRQLGSVKSHEYCRVAEDDSRVTGMVSAFPIDGLADAPSDPRLTSDRLAMLAPVTQLLHQAGGSYYVSAVAVYPEFRGLGIGNRLMATAASDAQRLSFAVLSLLSFEQNERATALYRRLGFEIVARSAVVPHPLVHHTGDLLLMTRRL